VKERRDAEKRGGNLPYPLGRSRLLCDKIVACLYGIKIGLIQVDIPLCWD